MEHGSFVSQWYERDDTQTKIQYGLVCCKDIDIVYFITNFTATNESDSYFCRRQGYLI